MLEAEDWLDQLICATFEDAEFKNGSLPAAGMFDVLEHNADDLNYLKRLHPQVRPPSAS